MKCWSLIDLSTKEHGKRSEEREREREGLNGGGRE